MALINTSLPNLVQGVSQQPDTLRFDGQCEEQINALSSVADGLKKRPNARYVKNLLSTAIDEGAFVHFINRDKTEKYVLIINNNLLKVYNILTAGGPVKEETIGSGHYLYISDTTKPRDIFKALTVNDNTFILNTTTGVAKDTTTSGVFSDSGAVHNNQAIIFVKQGHYQTDYTIDIDFTDTTGAAKTARATYTSGPSATTGASPNARAGRIAFVLQEKIEAAVLEHGETNGFGISDVTQFTDHTNTTGDDGIIYQVETDAATSTGYGYPAFVISRTDGREFKIKVSDSKSGTALGVVYKEVDSISDLPKSAPNNFKVKV